MKDTDRKLLKETISIAWPAVIESFFTAFVGLVDSYMVSGLGSNAVAAVGLTTQPKFMGLSMFFALNVALSALVARRRGEDRKDDANRILVSGIAFILIAAAAGVLPFFLGARYSIVFWAYKPLYSHWYLGVIALCLSLLAYILIVKLPQKMLDRFIEW